MIPVKYVSIGDVRRGYSAGQIETDNGLSNASISKWLDCADSRHVDEDVARVAMVTGELAVIAEIGSTGKVAADAAISMTYAVPYVYSSDNATNVALTHTGRHFPVRPEMNDTVVKAMYSSQSADDWVKAAGIKLPRVNNNPARPSAVPDVESGLREPESASTAFEGLRQAAAKCAKSDDYGLRLHSLARIVCHAVVMNTMRKSHGGTKAMGWRNMTSMLSADTPGITAAELATYSWHYLHTDTTAEYRAFLVMGARGLENYVRDETGTAYSACVTEPELQPENTIVFVRVGGSMANNVVVPAPQAYTAVLNNPDLALAFYYAYAASMGIGYPATAVLIQTAMAPHVWGDRATSPYKNCRPRLDACRYVVMPNEERADVCVTDARQLVYQSAYVAAAVKAGLGCLLTAFSSGKDVDSLSVLEKNIGKMSDSSSSREVLKAVHQCFQGGNAGAEWLSPFSFDVSDGLDECVRSWRQEGILIGAYEVAPVSAITTCVDGGVDMHNAILGRRMTTVSGEKFAQLVISELASGVELTCMCERPTQASLLRIQSTVTRLREWRPVLTIVRLAAVKPVEDAHNNSPPKARTESDASSGERVVSNTASGSTVGMDAPDVEHVVSHRKNVGFEGIIRYGDPAGGEDSVSDASFSVKSASTVKALRMPRATSDPDVSSKGPLLQPSDAPPAAPVGGPDIIKSPPQPDPRLRVTLAAVGDRGPAVSVPPDGAPQRAAAGLVEGTALPDRRVSQLRPPLPASQHASDSRAGQSIDAAKVAYRSETHNGKTVAVVSRVQTNRSVADSGSTQRAVARRSPPGHNDRSGGTTRGEEGQVARRPAAEDDDISLGGMTI
jgi:hypothetical protein